MFLPFVRASTAAVRRGIERWADEDSVGGCPGGRRVVRDALMAAVVATAPVGVAAFGAVATIAERAVALQNPIEISAIRHRMLVVGLWRRRRRVAGSRVRGCFVLLGHGADGRPGPARRLRVRAENDPRDAGSEHERDRYARR